MKKEPKVISGKPQIEEFFRSIGKPIRNVTSERVGMTSIFLVNKNTPPEKPENGKKINEKLFKIKTWIKIQIPIANRLRNQI